MEKKPSDPRQNQKKQLLALGAILTLVIVGGIVYQVSLRAPSAPEMETPTGGSEAAQDDSALVSETAKATGDKTVDDDAATDSASAPASTVVSGANPSLPASGSDSTPGGATTAPSAGFFASLREKFNGFLGRTPAPDAPSVGDVDSGALAPGAEELAKSEAPKVDISRNCFVETFTHKPVKSHSSGEACSQHRNVLRIGQTDINPKSVCVRVNGNPVRFQTGKAGEFVLGPIAGPDSKITVRYCMAKAPVANCEDCRIPKDEFMEAIGGVAEDGSEGAAYVKWDPNGAEQDDDVSAKLDPELRRELANATDLKVFDGWMSAGGDDACHTKTAAKTSTSPNG